jgi:hypothetical protein
MVHRRLILLTATLSVLAAAGCGRNAPEPAQNRSAAAPAKPKPAPAIPLPEPKFEREQLILTALRAMSAAALGKDDSAAQKQLEGREFALRLRFGCPGAASTKSRSWSYDDKTQTLRAHFDADLSAEKVPSSDLLLKGYEGVVGFTVQRPLLLSAGCPTPQFATVTGAEPTIAVAQLFTSQESRVQRPEKSYDITKVIEDAEKPTQGLDLVVAGRFHEMSDGRIIHCAADDGPPVCIFSAKLDRVAIENPVSGTVLGEWSQW